MKEVSLIQRSFFFFLMSIISVYSYSQAYEYTCKYNEHIQKWQCVAGNKVGNNKEYISFSISGHSQYVCNMNFVVFSLTKDNSNQGLFEIYLSNGEILSTYVNEVSLMIGFNVAKIKSKNNPSVDITDNGNYAMYQLRHFDITKLKFAGRIFETPNFHSAATIDAMCKSLISKTGDRGQYGSSLGQTPSQNGQTPYVPIVTDKNMSFRQLLFSLFGVIPEEMTNKGLLLDQLQSIMKQYPQWPVQYGKYRAQIVYGTDMTYKGIKNSWYEADFLSRGPMIKYLTSYQFGFVFNAGDYIDHKAVSSSFFEDILNEMIKSGATMSEDRDNKFMAKCFKGTLEGRDIVLCLDQKPGSGYSGVSITVYVKF